MNTLIIMYYSESLIIFCKAYGSIDFEIMDFCYKPHCITGDHTELMLCGALLGSRAALQESTTFEVLSSPKSSWGQHNVSQGGDYLSGPFITTAILSWESCSCPEAAQWVLVCKALCPEGQGLWGQQKESICRLCLNLESKLCYIPQNVHGDVGHSVTLPLSPWLQVWRRHHLIPCRDSTKAWIWYPRAPHRSVEPFCPCVISSCCPYP